MLPPDDDALLRHVGLVDPPPASEGLFRDGCWLRRVSAEPVLLTGGGRALLLEVAHPLVAAGVAEHTNFRADPFGRLQRTLDAMNAIVFRDREAALEAARRVEATHDRVRGRLARAAGPFPAGTPYSGRDPELVCWVWATLVDTAVVSYERFVAPLEGGALDAYYADQKVLARLLGVPGDRVPPDAAAFRRYFEETVASDRLTVSEQAREIAEAVLDPPATPLGRRVLRDLTTWLLPPRIRESFGLAWDAERERRVAALRESVCALRRGAPSRPRAAAGSRLDGPREPR